MSIEDWVMVGIVLAIWGLVALVLGVAVGRWLRDHE